MEILSHALESYNLNFVPTRYYYIAKRYSEVRYDRKSDLAAAKLMRDLQAYNYLLMQDFPNCDDICKVLQEPYWKRSKTLPGSPRNRGHRLSPFGFPSFSGSAA